MPKSVFAVVVSLLLCWHDAGYAVTVEYVDVTHEGVAVRASVVPAGATLALTAQIFPKRDDGTAAEQLSQALEDADALLAKVGSSLECAARVNLYATTPQVAAETRAILTKAKYPVSAVVTDLPKPGALLAIDVVAAADATTSSDPANVRLLPSDHAVYISGMAAEGAMPDATRATLEQLGGVLQHLKIDRKDVVHVKAFLRGATDVSASKAELDTFFDGAPPPATWVEWTMKGPIEIELVARWNDASIGGAEVDDTVSYHTPPGVKLSPVYSKIALVHGGRTIYTSGVYAGAATDDSNAETRLALAALRELIQKAGGDFEHLVKATYYPMTDATSAALNNVRPTFFDPQRPPAASKAPARHTGDSKSDITLDLIGVTAK